MIPLGVLAAATADALAEPPEFVTRATGSNSSGSAFAPSTISVSMPSGTDPGLILVAIGGSHGSAAMAPALPGFTLLVDGQQVLTSNRGFLFIYGKITTGAESAVTFTHGTNGLGQNAYIAERWSGIDELPEVANAVAYTTSGTFTMTDNARTTTEDNSVVWSAIGGRAHTGGDVSESWGGGSTGLYGTASGQVGFVNNASQIKATAGTATPTCQITNTQGNPISLIASVILEPAGGGGGGGGPSVPAYVPAGHEDKYDNDTGGFNFHEGNTTRIVSSLEGADTGLAEHLFLGNSVGEGWTSLVGTTVTEDRLHAFPLMYRDKVADELGVDVAGTGHVRCRSVQLVSHYHDARWNSQVVNVAGGWSNGVHHISAATSAVSPIILTPDKTGTRVNIYAIDRAGALRVSIDGGADQIINGGGTNLPVTHTISGLSNAAHTVSIKPDTNTQITILGADVTNDVGLTVHNASQGGSKVRTGITGQDVWSDTASGVANMLPCYSHANMHGDADVVFIELGGNDLQNLDPDAEAEFDSILDGFEAVAAAFPNSDIVLLLITEGGSGFDADYPMFYELAMERALTNDWCVIDTQFILGGYDNMVAQGWATDAYGHLTLSGATVLGEACADAVLKGAGLI